MGVSRSLLQSTVSGWAAAQACPSADTETEASWSVEDRVSLHFRTLSDRVFGYVAHQCRNASDAEEIRQETFLRLYQALKRQDRIENVRCWVFRVARNLMLDRAKHLRRVAPKMCEMPDDAQDCIEDRLPTPEERMIELDRRQQLRDAMAQLTPLQRECIYLRSQGLQLREIGEILNMDLRRVAEVLQRGIASLKRILCV